MGWSCLICNNKFKKGSPISCHTFPKEFGLKKLWCEAVGVNILQITRSDVICSEHFSPNDIRYNPSGTRKVLAKSAVPSIAESSQSTTFSSGNTSPGAVDGNKENVCSDEVQNKVYVFVSRSPKQEIFPEEIQTVECLTKSMAASPPEPIKNTSSDETTSTLTASDEEMEGDEEYQLGMTKGSRQSRHFVHRDKETIRLLRATLLKQKQCITKLRRQNGRLKSRIECQNSLLKYLKDNNLLNKNAETIIKAISS